MLNYNDYREQKEKEFNEFGKKYLFFAFDNEDFQEGCQKLNINDVEDVRSIGGGGYIHKKNITKFLDLIKKYENIFRENIKNYSFLYDLFYFTFSNHEYIINQNDFCILYYSSIIDIDFDDYDNIEKVEKEINKLENKIEVLKAFEKAKYQYIEDAKKYNWL